MDDKKLNDERITDPQRVLEDQYPEMEEPVLLHSNGEDPAGPVPGVLDDSPAPEGGIQRNIWKYFVLGILLIGALCVAVWGINRRHPEEQLASKVTTQKDMKYYQGALDRPQVQVEEVVVVDSEPAATSATTQKAAATTQKSAAVSKTVTKATAKSTATTSSQQQSEIDRLAKLVIKGKYGVNPMRHEKLGNLYGAVQARVNQLLHK